MNNILNLHSHQLTVPLQIRDRTGSTSTRHVHVQLTSSSKRQRKKFTKAHGLRTNNYTFKIFKDLKFKGEVEYNFLSKNQ